ncbi:hypothetical protein [Aliivibrio fischeri]|uniref:hypothetical protein n=1 Tax=Aliivibrio fischeri TaxID=668 RepID=UPI001F3374D7|nr:hypothetical protein [Aliivibrio fischeri]
MFSVSSFFKAFSVALILSEKNGQSYLFRRTANQLTSLQIKSDKFELKENFAEWPIDELKKDQFIQQHSNFFKGKGQNDVYEWSRD